MSKKASLPALVLLVPAPSIGVLAGMIIAPNFFGRAVFFISKVWIIFLPLCWHLFIDRKNLSISIPSKGGFTAAILFGIIISAVITVVYFIAGRYLIEPQVIKDMAGRIGIDNRHVYTAMACYWILVNAAIEEYVWRWFVVQKCKTFLSAKTAIVISALCFTVHHVIAMQIYFGVPVVLVAAFGIFIAAILWSWFYNKYRSIWPGFVNHAIVDIAVFAIGYLLIFR